MASFAGNTTKWKRSSMPAMKSAAYSLKPDAQDITPASATEGSAIIVTVSVDRHRDHTPVRWPAL
jgi:hypothetical protein